MSTDEGIFWGTVLDHFEVGVIVVDFSIIGRVIGEEERIGGMIGFDFLIIDLELSESIFDFLDGHGEGEDFEVDIPLGWEHGFGSKE